jgi:beta-galactosidase
LLSENLKPRVLGKGYELVNVERNGRELTVVLNTLPIENNVYIDGSLHVLKTFELMFIG